MRIRRGPEFYALQLTDCLNGDWVQCAPVGSIGKASGQGSEAINVCIYIQL